MPSPAVRLREVIVVDIDADLLCSIGTQTKTKLDHDEPARWGVESNSAKLMVVQVSDDERGKCRGIKLPAASAAPSLQYVDSIIQGIRMIEGLGSGSCSSTNGHPL